MKVCTVLVLGLLAIGPAPAVLAQDKEAEKLFRDTEKKITGAKALKIVFSYQVHGRNTRGSLLLTDEDRARIRVKGHYYPGMRRSSEFELVSDGKHFKTRGAAIGIATIGLPQFESGGQTSGDTGKGFHKISAVILSRGGIGYYIYSLPYWTGGTGGRDPEADKAESKMTVYDFKFGDDEKIGERQARVIHYRFGKGGNDDTECTLWIDAEHGVPLKHVLSNAKGVFVGRFTNRYTEFTLNPKIEDSAFALPK